MSQLTRSTPQPPAFSPCHPYFGLRPRPRASSQPLIGIFNLFNQSINQCSRRGGSSITLSPHPRFLLLSASPPNHTRDLNLPLSSELSSQVGRGIVYHFPPSSPNLLTMGSDTATVAPESAAASNYRRNTKKRASIACQNCRSRKVRCNITQTGPPCVNCKLDRMECAAAPCRRGQRFDLKC